MNRFNRYDLAFLVASAGLLLVGLTMLYSMSLESGRGDFFSRQLLFVIVIGGGLMPLLSRVSLSEWRRVSRVIFFLVFMMLLATLLVGMEKNGAKRWLDLHVITLQPVEFWKFALLLLVSRYLAGVVTAGRHSLHGFALIVLITFPMVGIQPDFGSAVFMMVIVCVLFFLAGLSLRWLLLISVIFAVLAAWVLTFADYRLRRLYSFLDPFADIYGSGYNQVHSLMAFAHGKWWGVGLGRSVEKFGLPEPHNDFIIAIIAEELGMIGFIVICAIFLFLVMRAINIGRQAERRGEIFGALYAFGFAALFSMQVLINIGGSLALLPSKGITLPLISYGGSSLLATALMFSVLLRVDYENRNASKGDDDGG